MKAHLRARESFCKRVDKNYWIGILAVLFVAVFFLKPLPNWRSVNHFRSSARPGLLALVPYSLGYRTGLLEALFKSDMGAR